MSVYSDSSQAISDLAELHEVFTEIDVVNHAAKDGWSKAHFKEAKKYANQIVSAKFRNGEIVRYGPVEYDGIKDYARRAGQIVYGGAASGPEFWETPNGRFPQLPRHADNIQTSGRKKGTNRHDELPWADQANVPSNIKIAAKAVLAAVPTPPAAGKNGGAVKEIERLNAALSQASATISQLQAQGASKDREIEALRARLAGAADGTVEAGGLTRKDVEDLVLELTMGYDNRLSEMEEKMGRFTRAFTGAA